MLPEHMAGNPPRSIVTDHYLLDYVLDLRVEREFFLGLVLLILFAGHSNLRLGLA